MMAQMMVNLQIKVVGQHRPQFNAGNILLYSRSGAMYMVSEQKKHIFPGQFPPGIFLIWALMLNK
jgi:hypothetical protein